MNKLEGSFLVLVDFKYDWLKLSKNFFFILSLYVSPETYAQYRTYLMQHSASREMPLVAASSNQTLPQACGSEMEEDGKKQVHKESVTIHHQGKCSE